MEPEEKEKKNKSERLLDILKKIVKGIFVAITIMVTVAGLLLGMFMIPFVQDTMRDKVETSLEEALGVNVEMDELVYFPFNTIGLNDLVIYGEDEREMIKAGNTRVNVGISTLWHGGLVLTSVSMDSLEVDIHGVKGADGSYRLNISKLMGEKSDSARSEKMAMEIDAVDLRNGQIRYKGIDGRSINVADIRLALRDIVVDDEGSKVDIRRISATDVTNHRPATIKGSIEQRGDTIGLESLIVMYGESKIDVKKSQIVTDERLSYDIYLQPTSISASSIEPFVGVGLLPSGITVEASGHIKGDKANIKADNLSISAGEKTGLRAEMRIANMDDTRRMKVDVTCHQMMTSLGDIGKITGRETNPLTDIAVGPITYRGQITGGLDALRIDGTLAANIGSVVTNVVVNALGAKTEQGREVAMGICGQVKTKMLDLTNLTNGKVGVMAFDTDMDTYLDKRGDELEWSFTKAKGEMPELTVLGYTYRNIVLDGISSPHYHSGYIGMNDENGNITLVGEYDERAKKSGKPTKLNITTRIEDFRTGRTNITPGLDATLNVSMGLNASGTDIDNADAELWINSLDFRDSTRVALAHDMSLQVECDQDDYKALVLQSDHLNGWMKGTFKYADLANEIYRQIYAHTSVLLDEKPEKKATKVDAYMEINYSDANQYVQFVNSDLKIDNSGKIRAGVSSEADSSYVNLELGSIEYGDTSKKGSFHRLKNTKGNVGISKAGIQMTLSADETTIVKLGNVGKVNLVNTIKDNTLATYLKWDNHHRKDSGGDIGATTLFRRSALNGGLIADISLDESIIKLKSHEWKMHQSDIEIGNDHFYVDHFRFDHNDRFITVDGRASESMGDTLAVNINKLTIEDILPPDPYERYALAGDLNADLKCIAIYDKPEVNGQITIDRFHVDEDNLEHLDVAALWSTEEKQLGLDVKIVTGGKTRAHGIGGIDSFNSRMNLDFDIDSLSIGFLNYYLNTSVSGVKGTTSGKCQLHGPLNDIGLDARLVVNRTDFRVKSTMVDYAFANNDSVILSPTNIEIRRVGVTDIYGNKGVFYGNIKHDMYSNLVIDLGFDVNDMLVLDMTSTDNPTYYGIIYAKGNLAVTGTCDNTSIVIKANTRPGTTFCVLPNAKSDRSDTKYIRFKSANDDKVTEEKAEEEEGEDGNDRSLEKVNSWVVADLNVHIEPTSKASVIIDPRTDNKIDAMGTGDLKLYFDRAGDLSMTGVYTIDEGKYRFSLENVINRQFDIKKGSTIEWDGEPFDPNLRINATYEVKSSLYDLVQNSAAGQDLKKRVPIICNLTLTDRMSDPGIKFKIEVPSMMKSNQYLIDQYITTEEETNRQVFSLLAFDHFYASTENAGAQKVSTSTVAATTLSELITNQFSNWFSQNKYNLDIGINYRPGDEVNQEEYELALSTRVLNNKIILSGNIGYGRNTTEQSDGSVIGDFDMEVKIKGNLSAKAYTHSNNDIIYETSPTTQGVGITYREEFNSWGELLKKYWKKLTTRRKDREKAETDSIK